MTKYCYCIDVHYRGDLSIKISTGYTFMLNGIHLYLQKDLLSCFEEGRILSWVSETDTYISLNPTYILFMDWKFTECPESEPKCICDKPKRD